MDLDFLVSMDAHLISHQGQVEAITMPENMRSIIPSKNIVDLIAHSSAQAACSSLSHFKGSDCTTLEDTA